jgi:predicted GNAT family N-acyltransferase
MHLLPLTATRPMGELRIGILTIREKWERLLRGSVSYITQEYLQEKYPIHIEEDNLILNGGILPTEQLSRKIADLQQNEALLLNGELIATTRLFNIDQSYPGYQSIGRVVGSPRHRGIGAGKALMQFSIAECERLFGKHPIKIGAQLYLKKFYGELGWEQAGEMYYEDAIEHIPMIRK